jgi:hypothetical protein
MRIGKPQATSCSRRATLAENERAPVSLCAGRDGERYRRVRRQLRLLALWAMPRGPREERIARRTPSGGISTRARHAAPAWQV